MLVQAYNILGLVEQCPYNRIRRECMEARNNRVAVEEASTTIIPKWAPHWICTSTAYMRYREPQQIHIYGQEKENTSSLLTRTLLQVS
jgi:hypothetical protein